MTNLKPTVNYCWDYNGPQAIIRTYFYVSQYQSFADQGPSFYGPNQLEECEAWCKKKLKELS